MTQSTMNSTQQGRASVQVSGSEHLSGQQAAFTYGAQARSASPVVQQRCARLAAQRAARCEINTQVTEKGVHLYGLFVTARLNPGKLLGNSRLVAKMEAVNPSPSPDYFSEHCITVLHCPQMAELTVSCRPAVWGWE